MASFASVYGYFGAHSIQNRAANERERAIQRAIIGLIFSVLTMGYSIGAKERSALLLATPYLAMSYTVLSLAYMRLLRSRPEGMVHLQYGFLVFDPVFSIVALSAAPAVTAALNPLIMVQIVRCGIRFGIRTLWLSWACAVIASVALMPTSDFWTSQEELTRSYIVMMLITPLLFGPITKRLHIVTGELRAAATSDPLTGLGNRRMLAEHLRLALGRAMRDQTMLAVLVFDLDNFKSVNDTMGHNIGDRLLERISSAVKKASRAGDFLARTGGDEFVLLVEGLSTQQGRDQVQHVAAKIIAIVQAAAAETCPAVAVSASVGINCWSSRVGPDATVPELIDVADRAMYSAKRAGKSQVVFADP